MTWLLDTRDDGSVALFIDGSIQFDSRDERIYHEGLVGPALSLQLQPDRKPISALIIGGGDGLVARELLKHPSVQLVDLVDRDEQITSMASTQKDLLEINCRSLLDDRLKVTTCDAWDFVERSRQMYDLIISDLTVPQTRAETRMHSVEWYTRLRALLNECGSLAANSASPCQNPRAFWSITNSIRQAGLWARPYRVAIPSFAQRGYGPDWGFVLASMSPLSDWQKRALRANEDDIGSALSTSGGRPNRLTFRFPNQVAEVRHLAPPIAAETNDLLDSFRIANYVKAPWQMEWDALEALLELEPLLEVRVNELLLPATVTALLKTTDKGDQLLFAKLGMIMPGLSEYQSPEMVADFLSLPFRLLKSIDLQSLVNSLVARSIELPQAVLEELLYLRDTLRSFNFENIDLLAVSSRVLSIITLVVVISNLVSPDAAYGKGGCGGHSGGGGGHFSGGGSHFSGGCGHFGSGFGHFGSGGGHFGGLFGGHFGFGGVATAHGASPGSLHCHFGNFGNHASWYGLCHHGNAFSQQYFGGGYPINVLGRPCNRTYFNIYPTQVYFNFPLQIPSIQPAVEAPPFMLADNVYVLPDGTIAVVLSEKVGLLLGRRYNIVVDIKTGQPLMQLRANQDEIHMLVGNLDQELSSLAQESRRRQALQTWASTASVSTYTRNPNQAELDNIASTITLLSQAREQLSVEAVIKQPGTLSGLSPSTENLSTEKPASTGTKETVPAEEIVPTGDTASSVLTSASNGSSLPKAVSEDSAKTDPLTNTAELFPGVSIDNDGRFVVLHMPDDTYAYMNGLAWYADPQMTRVLQAPYPREFGKFIFDYSKEQMRGGGHAMKEEDKELNVATSHLDNLRKEQASYLEKQAKAKDRPEDQQTVMVRYGISKIPVAEALTKIDSDIVSAKAAADAVDRRKGGDVTRLNTMRSLQNTFKLRG